MSILNKNIQNCDHIFAKISLMPNLDTIIQKSENKLKTENPFVVVRLCPLDKCMNNVEKLEIITWPTIYITNAVSKKLGSIKNSKVILELINKIDNDICNVQNIYISPLKIMVR